MPSLLPELGGTEYARIQGKKIGFGSSLEEDRAKSATYEPSIFYIDFSSGDRCDAGKLRSL
jgi:hypothetical protein